MLQALRRNSLADSLGHKHSGELLALRVWRVCQAPICSKVLDLMVGNGHDRDGFRVLLYGTCTFRSDLDHGNTAWKTCDFAPEVLCSPTHILAKGILRQVSHVIAKSKCRTYQPETADTSSIPTIRGLALIQPEPNRRQQ